MSFGLNFYLYAHYYLAVSSDPGYLPRFLDRLARLDTDSDQARPRREEPVADSETEPLEPEFCSGCCVYKVLDSHHCSICNCCVMGMDHHCRKSKFAVAVGASLLTVQAWFHNCIGALNLRHFMLVLWYGSLGCVHTHCLLVIYGHQVLSLMSFRSYYTSLALYLSIPLVTVTLFVANVCFVLTETSSVAIARESFGFMLGRLWKVRPRHVKRLFRNRFAVESMTEYFLSVGSPEQKLLESQIRTFHKVYYRDLTEETLEN